MQTPIKLNQIATTFNNFTNSTQANTTPSNSVSLDKFSPFISRFDSELSPIRKLKLTPSDPELEHLTRAPKKSLCDDHYANQRSTFSPSRLFFNREE